MNKLGNLIDTNYDFEYIPRTTRLAGVTFNNRQDFINKLRIGTNVKFIRDSKNEFDKNAIKVIVNNFHLGWIPKDLAAILAPEIDAGFIWCGEIDAVIGLDKPNQGVIIRLIHLE